MSEVNGTHATFLCNFLQDLVAFGLIGNFEINDISDKLDTLLNCIAMAEITIKRNHKKVVMSAWKIIGLLDLFRLSV